MNNIEIKNAVIEDTSLGFEDRGILTAFLYLNYGNSSQGFGGYSMTGQFCSEFIKNVLTTVGVENWEELTGKHIRAETEHTKIHRIGNITKDEWFSPSELAEKITHQLDKDNIK